MNMESMIVWLILGVVIVLLASDRLAADGIAVAGLLALVIAGSLQPGQALAGFSSPAVIAIASLLVLSAALDYTGVVRRLATRLHHLARDYPSRVLLAGTLVPGVLSGLINIVAAVSVFIPVLLRIALRARMSPSRLLLPMAYASMAGASLTLIGASHNLVVNDILSQRTGIELGLLEIAPVGIVMIALATLYSLAGARWLLPKQQAPEDIPAAQTRDLFQRYAFDERIWELEVLKDSPLVGRKLGDLKLANDYGLSLISLVHPGHKRHHLRANTSLEGGDILLVGGRRQRVEQATEDIEGLELQGAPAYRDDFSAGSAELIEVLVPPRSDAVGQSVQALELRKQADLSAIGLWRDGKPLRTDVETSKLEVGDALLLYGDKHYTRGFEPEPDFRWLHPPQKASAPARQQKRLAPWTLLIFALVIISAALELLPIALAALAGALLVTLIGALKVKQAYDCIEWRSLVLIAAMLPFATALSQSGASAQLAEWLITTFDQWGPLAMLALLALITLVLTQPLHNAAAAAVMTPVALDVALQLGANPKTFAIAIIVAASMSVLMPAGHPAPLLVRQSGDYSAADYVRFGLPLALLTLLVIVLLVPWLWPLIDSAEAG